MTSILTKRSQTQRREIAEDYAEKYKEVTIGVETLTERKKTKQICSSDRKQQNFVNGRKFFSCEHKFQICMVWRLYVVNGFTVLLHQSIINEIPVRFFVEMPTLYYKKII